MTESDADQERKRERRRRERHLAEIERINAGMARRRVEEAAALLDLTKNTLGAALACAATVSSLSGDE